MSVKELKQSISNFASAFTRWANSDSLSANENYEQRRNAERAVDEELYALFARLTVAEGTPNEQREEVLKFKEKNRVLREQHDASQATIKAADALADGLTNGFHPDGIRVLLTDYCAARAKLKDL